MAWQLHEAKQRFSHVVRLALDEGPQVVTRHGREAVVIVSATEFHRLARREPDFKAFLLSLPDLDDLPIRRSKDRGRAVETAQ